MPNGDENKFPDKSPIYVEGLTHIYGTRTAINGVSFSVKQREIFGLLGPNGSGKTTIFRILSTLIPQTSGHIRVFALDITRHSRYIRKHLGVVFQSPSLDKKLTVTENLRHQGHLYGIYGKVLQDRIAQMLARFGLSDRAHDLVETLSGGLRRRAELAKALLHRPNLLLLDEPSAGLDPGARQDLWRYLEQLRSDQGVTILLTTHLMDEAEKCDRVGILNRGELIALDSPEALKRDVGGDVIAIETKEPDRLRDQIRDKFGGAPTVVDGVVHIKRQQGHEFIARLVEAFPGQIDAIRMRKPTLEDVFIQRTGHKFWDAVRES